MDLTGADVVLSTLEEASDARRKVRAHAAASIADDDVLGDVELMAGEAIANALLHGTPPVIVTVSADRGRLRVEVHDCGPRVHSPNGSRVDHGRGLRIIGGLAETWTLLTTVQGTVLVFEVDC